ncbi:MAG: alkylation response protein AidB-like acyl-CoA dehydrogenase [Gammaproteobacteria bacterium]|jgi:alkylation response protein AidB-like acyl-CoA dehydrogenase
MYDIDLTSNEQELVARAKTFATSYVAPRAAQWELNRSMPRDGLREAARLGLTGLDSPKESGGTGTGFNAKLLVLEALSEVDMAFAFSLTNTQGIAGRIAADGTASQKERFLEDLLTTERLGATALTEPSAGSDFAAIQMDAKKVTGGWCLNGEKAWITNAAEADVFLVYAQTDPAKRWRGIASFLVDGRQSGFRRSEPYDLLAGHAIGTGGFSLIDMFVPDEDLVSHPGDAFKSAMHSINGARTYVAGMLNAMMHASLSHAVQYAAKRQTFGKTLIEHQGLKWSLADVATKLEASRLLTYRAARLIQHGGDAMLAASYAKKFAGDVAIQSIADCIQAMGANGMGANVPLGRHLACAKLACYTDGSTEVQNDRIGASLVDIFGD